jgi:hypothetical protein
LRCLEKSDVRITAQKSINVLGVVLDSKLNWDVHMSHTINKSNRALNALKIFCKYFNTKELLQLITSNFYSILFYNSEIWHSSYLNDNLKHKLFVTLSNALKLSLHYPEQSFSFKDLHKITSKATPNMIINYKCAFQLFKTYYDCLPVNEWLYLNVNQILISQNNFSINRSFQSKIGKNSMCK